MDAKLLNGREIASQIQTEITKQIQTYLRQGLREPCLSVIMLGENPASQVYVNRKRKVSEQIGIRSLAYDLPASTSEAELLSLVKKLNEDKNVDGILIQLPLPSHIDADHVLETINPQKDVDGFHPYNIGRLAQKRPLLRPCTPFGIIKLLEHTDIKLPGLNAVIVGASNIVGRPMALELLMAKCTVTICHSNTRDLSAHVKQADLLVAAVGKTDLISSEWIKPGAIVIDVGMNRLADGRLVGDIDFDTAKKRASWITPVPGGVGQMTVAMLMANTVLAYQKHLSL